MKKQMKGFLAMILCVCMIAGNGIPVYADEISSQEEIQPAAEPADEMEVPEAEIQESGNAETAEAESEQDQATETEQTAEEETAEETEPADRSGEIVEMDGRRETNELYGMNADGSMFLMPEDETAALSVDETDRDNAGARTTGVKIVNFRATSSGTSVSSSATTSYTEYGTGASGYVCGAYGADAAYLGTEGGKVKFMLSGVVGLVDASKVQVANLANAKSYSSYYAEDTFLVHKIATNLAQSGSGSSVNVGTRPSYLTPGTTYYSYDGHYFYTDYARMLGDYQAGNRNNAVNAGDPYYNYYQFLPSRSKTNYSGDELSGLINKNTKSGSVMYNTGGSFVNRQNTYGTNALLMVGVGANESGWGSSNYAKTRNNLFGIGAVDSNPDNATYFSSVDQCIKDYSETYLSKRYLRAGYTYYHGGFLGDKASGMNVSWASDPYWGEKAAGIAWNLDKAGGYKDKEQYTIGIKDTINTNHNSVNVKKEESSSSATLYHTGSISNYAVLIRSYSDEFYEIQSDPVLNSGRTAVDTGTGNYNFEHNYAYISKDAVAVVSGEDNLIDESAEGVTYSVHAQTYGWMSKRMDGQQAGTIGEAKRLEALKLELRNQSADGGVEYRTHVQSYGWMDWMKNGEEAGTSGEAKRMEAVQIRLTGVMAEKYDIYYRVHCQTYGWLDWAKNGEKAGSSDYAKRMEAIQIKLVAKGGNAPGETGTPYVQSLVKCKTHVQTYGWQGWKLEGQTSGTSGEAKRLEAIQIELMNQEEGIDGSVEYRTHVQSYGWQDWKKEGEEAGTSGEAKRLEAIQIRLTGAMAENYDIYYRVHAQTYGWLDWAKNGEYAGSAGAAKRLEAIELKLVKKGGEAPGVTDRTFVQPMLKYQTHVESYGWQGLVDGGAVAGTRNEAKRVEAVQIQLSGQKYTGSIEYKVRVQGEGWRNFVNNGATAGTTGQKKAIEAIQIQLSGQMEKYYDVYYRAYCQTYGWLDWAKNGEAAGTEGLNKRMEAIQIVLVDKGEEAPGETEEHLKK